MKYKLYLVIKNEVSKGSRNNFGLKMLKKLCKALVHKRQKLNENWF